MEKFTSIRNGCDIHIQHVKTSRMTYNMCSKVQSHAESDILFIYNLFLKNF